MAVQVVTGQSSLNFNFQEVATLVFSATGVYPASPIPNPAWSFINATGGALGLDTIHAKQYTLAATTQALDLQAGTLLSPSGAACVFARVRIFCLAVVSTAAGYTMQYYGSATNAPAWLPLVAVPLYVTSNGGVATPVFDPNSIGAAGYLVDATHKSITLNSGANTVIANLFIAGNSSAA